MDLNEYQRETRVTDRVPGRDGNAILVPLLGLASETASLLSQHKKWLRDGPAHRLYAKQVAEELGDILWYTANVADKFELDLDSVARDNLAKTRDRFPATDGSSRLTAPYLFDAAYAESERFPSQFVAKVAPAVGSDGVERTSLMIDGESVGDPLRDNAYEDDGFRFHDVLHLAHLAMLGWSPAMRRLLRRKRKSDPAVDEVEDGARARVIDEGIVAFVFDYARRHDWLEGVNSIDYELLRSLRSVTAGLEVGVRSAAEWEIAILTGYAIWRPIRARGFGTIAVDIEARSMRLVTD
ncbi:MAG: hypothetical protein QOH61_1442 [Chloroflexota bacterium]|jgi:NTP pyrophosphatase (non-canonical NTP hydrolase)|nr:hypothetical protein [Chloroflexota bacterium]